MGYSGILLVFLGGGCGSVLRYAANQAGLAVLGASFPWGTLFVNVVGSFAMGAVASWFTLRGAGSELPRLFLTTGVLGGFTTFSAFSLDVAVLWERGQPGSAAFYALASVACSLVAVFAGLAAMRAVLS